MPSNKYWEKRQVLDAFEVFRDAEDLADDIAVIYQKASGYLTNEAREIFEKFRRKYGLTEKEAYQLISTLRDSKDLDELLWRLKNVEQTETIMEIRKQIESAAFQARLERLRQLQNELDLIMTAIYEQELQKNTAFYVDLANESYYKAIFRMQQRTGLGFSFSHIDRKIIDKVLAMNWSGRHYSERIWRNVTQLAKTLKVELLVNLLVGRTERELAEIIRKKFGAAASAARRLVRTESNYVSTELNAMAYEEAGVEEYLYLATLDLRTSKICRSLDGKIFKVAERKVGANCPPMHPWCRSTTIAVIDRELLKELERRARDPVTNKLIKVPMTMTYPEWYDKYVKGHEKEIEAAQKKDVERIGLENADSDRQQYEKYKRIFGEEVPDTLEEFREMKYNDPEKWADLKSRKQEAINAMDVDEVKKLNGVLGNREARTWYVKHDKAIPDQIDTSKGLEEQARQAHGLRNENKKQARDLMLNQKERRQLDVDEPITGFEELVRDKMDRKGLSREEALKDIIKTAGKTRKSVNKKYGVE